MERCLFPARVGIFSFLNNMIEILLPICALAGRLNIYVSRQGKGLNRKNGSIVNII